ITAPSPPSLHPFTHTSPPVEGLIPGRVTIGLPHPLLDPTHAAGTGGKFTKFLK
ncbi:hypothetical protein J6590_049251, partial [Homalodisca vitripennis]